MGDYLVKIWSVDGNFVLDTVRVFDFIILIFDGVNHDAVTVPRKNVAQVSDDCVTIV